MSYLATRTRSRRPWAGAHCTEDDELIDDPSEPLASKRRAVPLTISTAIAGAARAVSLRLSIAGGDVGIGCPSIAR